MPKVAAKPRPDEATVWTAYIQGGRMRARLHPVNEFHMAQYDCELYSPENFCAVVDAFRELRE